MDQHLQKVGNQPVIKQLNTISQYNQIYPIFFYFSLTVIVCPEPYSGPHILLARSIQPKFRPLRPGKVDQFFRNFSGWTEPIHWVSDRNFRKFWLNGSLALPPCFICLSRSVGGGGWGQRYKLMSIYPKEFQRIPLFCFVFLVCFFVCLCFFFFFFLPKQDFNSGLSFLILKIRCTGP